jgi:hypothetical protein
MNFLPNPVEARNVTDSSIVRRLRFRNVRNIERVHTVAFLCKKFEGVE